MSTRVARLELGEFFVRDVFGLQPVDLFVDGDGEFLIRMAGEGLRLEVEEVRDT